jgi:hypothetical protein
MEKHKNIEVKIIHTFSKNDRVNLIFFFRTFYFLI